ncbi:hypothetical protein PanWU01x14_185340 [Parasponia andersonii]|uniref:Uncharacterized protein n=1 Tax=Parasponia andersonii TaxID=3476 RepID=A0A2P5C499_PARAD|nr:hypothetical protein PanWU01x14_185340 [Parasponia andersonii]
MSASGSDKRKMLSPSGLGMSSFGVQEFCRSGQGYILITLLALTSSDVGPSIDPSPAKGSIVAYRVRSKVPTGQYLVVSSEEEAGGQGVITPRIGSDDDLENLFASRGETPVVPSPEAGRLTIREVSAIKIMYGKGAPSSLPGEPAAPTSSAPSSGSKASVGSSAAHSHGEIAELSGGALRLTSRLSSPPPVSMKRGQEADSPKGKESPVEKRGRTAPSSDNDDDRATLTLMKRRRSARGGPSKDAGQDKTEKLQPGGSPREVEAEAAEAASVSAVSSTEDALPPAITEGVPGDALLSTAPNFATSGASKEATRVRSVGG